MVPLGAIAARIAGTGVAFPTCTLPTGQSTPSLRTEDLFHALTPDLSEERRAPILEHLMDAVGIERRSWAHYPGTPFGEGEDDTKLLAAEAVRRALDDADLDPIEVGFVLVATSTPPRWTAALSSLVAGELGLESAFLDIRSGCAGGLYALVVGAMMTQLSQRPVVVVGTDTFSKVTPMAERFAVLSLGDGAGAIVFRPGTEGMGFLGASFGGDGAHHHLATVPGCLPPQSLASESWTLRGNPEEFSRRIEEALVAAVQYAAASPFPSADLALIHASRRSMAVRVKETAGAAGRLWTESLRDHGSLGAAALPVAIHEARKAGALSKGATVLLASAGGGPSWGGALWKEAP